MATPVRPSLQSFRSDERGSVMIIFGLCLFMLIMFVACAIDYGRAVHAHMRLGAAIDASAIAAAKAMRDGNHTIAQAKVIARTFFDENMPRNAGKYTTVTDWDPQVNTTDGTVTITATGHVPTLFATIAGIKEIKFPKTATASFNTLDLEVALQLDMTGSMNWPDAKGRRKMDGLKEATNDLIDILISGKANTNKTRIAMAPFAAGVNAGAFAKVVSGGRAKNGCVYERRSNVADATDALPLGFDDLKARSDVTGSVQDCPLKNVVTALTDDKGALKAEVAKFDHSTSTAGHLGTAWGWYLLSPTWSSIWPGTSKPAAYGDKKTAKALLLMTDGIYNTVGGVNKGDLDPESPARARALCDAIKAQKITVYSVAFIVPTDPPGAEATLQYCASGSAKFFKAEDSAGLKAAFQAIAEDISLLRLSN